MHLRHLPWLLSCLVAAGAGSTRAQTSQRVDEATGGATELALASVSRPPRRHYDYSRFSNGPRRVPRPRGASLARAERLGIGDLDATREILRGRFSPALQAELSGERPGTLLWPVVGGHFGRGFGYTRRVRTDLRHNGIDIGAPTGAVVRAAADGLVVYSDNTLRGMGNAVVIAHPGGLVTLYAHNTRTTVQPGWRVRRGERIALVGQTGIARGPHLHFELRDRGRLVDPERMLRGQRSSEVNGPLVPLDGVPDDGSAAEPHVEAELEPDPTPASAADDAPQPEVAEWPFSLGSEASARAALHHPPALDEDTEDRLGQRFRNLLWPLKGGRVRDAFERGHQAVTLAAEPGTAVRAVADGVVIHVGELAGRTGTVVVLHREGWLSVYALATEIAVEAGQRVRRGEWIAHVAPRGPRGGMAPLHFEWWVDGSARDPMPHFVGTPAEGG